MSDRVFVLIALIVGLSCVAMTIGYAGTYSEYAPYRDGARVVGTVVRTEPHRRYVTLEIEYRYEGKKERTRAYPDIAAATAFPVGDVGVDRATLRAYGTAVVNGEARVGVAPGEAG